MKKKQGEMQYWPLPPLHPCENLVLSLYIYKTISGAEKIAELSNGNPLVIMRMLRHKSFKNSLKYIHSIQNKEQDYEVTTVTTPEEILALGKAGWTKYDEITVAGTAIHFFRRPKRFGGLNQIQVVDKVE